MFAKHDSNDFFDAVYVGYLASQPQRLSACMPTLQYLSGSAPIHTCKAVTPDDPQIPKLYKKLRNEGQYGCVVRGEPHMFAERGMRYLSVSQTHANMVEDALEKGYEYVLFCEDDVLLRYEFILPKPPQDWDALYLGGIVNDDIEDAAAVFIKQRIYDHDDNWWGVEDGVLGAMAYALNLKTKKGRRLARMLILCWRDGGMVDHVLPLVLQQRGRTYMMKRRPISDIGSGSTLAIPPAGDDKWKAEYTQRLIGYLEAEPDAIVHDCGLLDRWEIAAGAYPAGDKGMKTVFRRATFPTAPVVLDLQYDPTPVEIAIQYVNAIFNDHVSSLSRSDDPTNPPNDPTYDFNIIIPAVGLPQTTAIRYQRRMINDCWTVVIQPVDILQFSGGESAQVLFVELQID